MKLILAPNSFRDSLTAFEAVAAMKRGINRAGLKAEVIERPMADGGDGTLQVVVQALDADLIRQRVTGPLGGKVEAIWGMTASGTAIIEMAEAAGNRLLPAKKRNPMMANTYGVGELIRAALDRGAREILIGAGGSATVDGGAGALAALGVRFLDRGGNPLQPTPAALMGLKRVDLGTMDHRLSNTRLTVLADVKTPARHAARLYGPQKNLNPADHPKITTFWRRLAACGGKPELIEAPMSGTAGGLALGLKLFVGAEMRPGAKTIADMIGLSQSIGEADLVFTGEGRFDSSSLVGKATGVITSLAENRIPVVVFAGSMAPGMTCPQGTTCRVITPQGQEAAAALQLAGANLAASVANFLKTKTS